MAGNKNRDGEWLDFIALSIICIMIIIFYAYIVLSGRI